VSVKTYKCNNCSAPLRLDPASGRFACDYCLSSFTIDELKHQDAEQEDQPGQENAEQGRASEEAFEQSQQNQQDYNEFEQRNRLYHCPSCGADVFADDTTVATFCVYCHNPVVLSGKLKGDHYPDQVLPFSVQKDKVKDLFLAWCRKKKFIDKGFFSQAQVEKLTGVYFPFWVVDGNADVSMKMEATKTRVWRAGNYRYTETSYYDIYREGFVEFEDITFVALDKSHAYILNGIQPFYQAKVQPFSMAYLSGFLAEKRNTEKQDAQPLVEGEVNNFTRKLVGETVQGYGSVSRQHENIAIDTTDWKYVLMPAWMLTYNYKGENYYFALNGDTGKVAGRVPLSYKRLWGLFAGLTAGIALVMMFVGWML
jgi:DNA-directed RNA polymerase subunit RPC12/RpoP